MVQEDKKSWKPVYVTRWGLTRGILRVVGGKFSTSEEDADRVYFSKGGIFVPNTEWAHSLPGAIALVQEQAVRKIASCKRAITKYEEILKDGKKIKLVDG